MIKIKALSDIHLEFGKTFKIDLTDIDVLCLAGDVGTGLKGLDWCKEVLKQYSDIHIVYVSGNHEFYFGNIEKINTKLSEYNLVKNRFHHLENNSVVINGVRFIGATLWTGFDNRNPLAISCAEFYMNDYKYIRYGEQYARFSPYRAALLHENSVKYIFDTINQSKENCVIITHHKPHLTEVEHPLRSECPLLQFAYETDLTKKFDKLTKPKLLWLSGHSHDSEDLMVQYQNAEVRFISNCVGYPHELNTNFNEDLIIEID